MAAEVVAEQREVIAERSDDAVPGLQVRADAVEQGRIKGRRASMGGDWDDVAPKTRREAKDYATGDRIRDELEAMGLEVMDTPEGTRVRPRDR